MPLSSNLFTKPDIDRRLEDCLVDDGKHITPGAVGDHVRKIQLALNALSAGAGRENFNLTIDGKYGADTANAVTIFKNAPQRRILQPWQTTADPIVGKRTIKQLDDELSILDNELPLSSALICSDVFGAAHNHSKCAAPKTNGEIEVAPDGTMSHFATPLNPLGSGRMVNIGGAKEAEYLGFVDFVPDPRLDPSMPTYMVNGRPLTSSLSAHTVSDVFFRSTPLDKFMQTELRRICMAGARLTYVSNAETFDDSLMNYFRSLGIIRESGRLADKPGQPLRKDRLFVIVSVVNILRP